VRQIGQSELKLLDEGQLAGVVLKILQEVEFGVRKPQHEGRSLKAILEFDIAPIWYGRNVTENGNLVVGGGTTPYAGEQPPAEFAMKYWDSVNLLRRDGLIRQDLDQDPDFVLLTSEGRRAVVATDFRIEQGSVGDSRRVLRVFLASPGDLGPERRRAKEVVDELNQAVAAAFGYVIELLGWEDTLPGYERAQALINADVEKSDLFVGMLWKRWGHPTGTHSSGFDEEFSLATSRCESLRRPEIWLFFKDVPADASVNPDHQLERVMEFKAEVERANCPLFKQFATTDEWEKKLRVYLAKYLNRLTGPQPESQVDVHSSNLLEARMRICKDVQTEWPSLILGAIPVRSKPDAILPRMDWAKEFLASPPDQPTLSGHHWGLHSMRDGFGNVIQVNVDGLLRHQPDNPAGFRLMLRKDAYFELQTTYLLDPDERTTRSLHPAYLVSQTLGFFRAAKWLWSRLGSVQRVAAFAWLRNINGIWLWGEWPLRENGMPTRAKREPCPPDLREVRCEPHVFDVAVDPLQATGYFLDIMYNAYGFDESPTIKDGKPMFD
jgi:hypothetical protein